MANYIYPAPGTAGVQATLTLKNYSLVGTDTGLVVPSLQDITVNNANDVFTWTQLDSGSKFQIATTSTNSLNMNLVLDQDTFFGTGLAVTGFADEDGFFGLSKDKTKVWFELYLGDEDDGGDGKYLTGTGYVTGLAPTVSSDSPVWVSPITISITGDFTVSDTSSV